jgi:hypothetical protein
MKLSSNQVSILKDVIKAANEGRYCHGNGANWVYVSSNNSSIVIAADHVAGTVKEMSASESENYLRGNRPYKSADTATSLEKFIKDN